MLLTLRLPQEGGGVQTLSAEITPRPTCQMVCGSLNTAWLRLALRGALFSNSAHLMLRIIKHVLIQKFVTQW